VGWGREGWFFWSLVCGLFVGVVGGGVGLGEGGGGVGGGGVGGGGGGGEGEGGGGRVLGWGRFVCLECGICGGVSHLLRCIYGVVGV